MDLSGIVDALKMGARGTLDAAQEDISSVSQGHLPDQLIRALGDSLNAYGGPGGMTVPTAYQHVFDPKLGWQLGQGMTPGQSVLQSGVGGKVGDLIQALMKYSSPAEGQTTSSLKKMNPSTQSFAELAKPGVQPLSAPHEMLPGLMDEITGQISHSMTKGPYQHSALYNSIPKSWRPTPVWVDPQTWNAFTEKMLETLRGGQF